jgi:hypothetical protein
MFIYRPRLAQPPATEEEDAEQLLLLNCLHSEKQEHRFLLLQCHTPSLRTNAPPCLPVDMKDSTEGGKEVFCFGAFLLWRLLLFVFLIGKALALGFLASGFGAFVFLMWEAFGREKNC